MKTDDQSGILEYQMALADDGSYLRNTVFVDMTNELVERFTEEMIRLSDETGVLKHFVDVTKVRSTQSATDMYMLTYKGLSTSMPFNTFKVAILKHPDDKSHDFIETLLINNGVNGKIFKNADEALAWLSINQRNF
ncbi:MAG: hypothetical protein HQ552_11480 [Desulfobacteraceae bacterium]|nr:hypothetical protein [Desulfobacteraceae bacterium]